MLKKCDQQGREIAQLGAVVAVQHVALLARAQLDHEIQPVPAGGRLNSTSY